MRIEGRGTTHAKEIQRYCSGDGVASREFDRPGLRDGPEIDESAACDGSGMRRLSLTKVVVSVSRRHEVWRDGCTGFPFPTVNEVTLV